MEGLVRIREAVIGDLPALIEIGQMFLWEAADPYRIKKPDVAAMATALLHLLRSDMATIIVAEEADLILGAIGATLLPFWFAPHVLAAKEDFWYVRPGSRGGSAALRLLRAFEEWAKVRGAEKLVVANIAELKGNSVGRFLERQGYRPAECFFSKEA